MTGLLRYPGGPAFYSVASRLMNKSELIIVTSASFLIFLLTLPLALRLWCLLFKVLLDYRFTRLVTVILVAQRMLLPDLAGISIS